jgi:hypothetical protein
VNEEEFPLKEKWFEWRKRKISGYGKNKVRLTVTKVEPLTPKFRLAYPGEWEPWKRRKCDAGFEPGQQLEVEEGKKLVSGEIFCFSAIYYMIDNIWGVTYDAWFPWNNRLRGPDSNYLKGKEELYPTQTMFGVCPDKKNTVFVEIKKTVQ